MLRTFAVATVLLPSACGSPATHNSADVAFAQDVVAHQERDISEMESLLPQG